MAEQAEPEVLQAIRNDWDPPWIPSMPISTNYNYFPFKKVLLTLWKGANKTTIANQALCSPGGHDGKDLCIIKMATYVLCSTAGLIDIWVSAPCLQILVLFSKFWNDSYTSADNSSKITLKNF